MDSESLIQDLIEKQKAKTKKKVVKTKPKSKSKPKTAAPPQSKAIATSQSITHPGQVMKPDVSPKTTDDENLRKLLPHRSFLNHVCKRCGAQSMKGKSFTKLHNQGYCDDCADLHPDERLKESIGTYKTLLKEHGFRTLTFEDFGRGATFVYSKDRDRVILTSINGRVEQWRYESVDSLLNVKDVGLLSLSSHLKVAEFKSSLRGKTFTDMLENYERN